MSLLDADVDSFEIDLYYKFVKVGIGKKLVILKDEDARRQIEEQIEEQKDGAEGDKSPIIEKLTTTWKALTWKEQNEVVGMASKVVNHQTGETQFNFIIYRDAIIKRCLKSWDMVVDGNPVPLTSENVDRLPGPVVLALYEKFEKANDYTEEEVKN